MSMVDRTKNRSDSYQHVLLESPCSPEMMMEMCEAESIGAQLNPFGYNDELVELKEKLKVEFWRVVDDELTSRQKEVLHLYAEGLTQTEIAKCLGVNQSSITKSINGNTDYRNGKRVYGGARKKIRKIIDKDIEIQRILLRISEIADDVF